ncbi:hypothetical protein QYE76_068615 [Lolium multiflorum]|uniref:Bidirectional sugar transporter SWEET n=1 Tax=Lolium multiflorum TaxID=4521 RepID=A0AAD8WCS2_LOLMU|nr:hypothetical protein QYE76_068615 [Lolium multiflorum]
MRTNQAASHGSMARAEGEKGLGMSALCVPLMFRARTEAGMVEDRVFNKGLLILTVAILGILFIADKGLDLTRWWSELAAMTAKQWLKAMFLAVGDILSLVLIFSPSGYFRRLWTGGAAGLEMLVPPLAGIINGGVWVAYGAFVEGKNISVIIINGTAVLFNICYTIVFFFRSGSPRANTLAMIAAAVAVAAMIAATDQYLLINTLGWKASEAVGLSGAITGSLVYFCRALASMMAAREDRGAGGFSGQTLGSIANALVWLTYACFQNDPNMMASSIVGICCFILQAGQLVFFYFNKPREVEGQAIHRPLLDP